MVWSGDTSPGRRILPYGIRTTLLDGYHIGLCPGFAFRDPYSCYSQAHRYQVEDQPLKCNDGFGRTYFSAVIANTVVALPFILKKIKISPNLTLLATLFISIASRWYLGQLTFLPIRSQDWLPTSRLFEFTLGIYLLQQFKKHKALTSNLESPTSIKSLADLSFPFFLIHHPLLFIIPHALRLGMPFALSVIIYLVISVFTSNLILIFGNKLQHKLMSLPGADKK